MWSAETVFVCALALLGRTEASFPTVEFVEKTPLGVSKLAQAYTKHADARIVIVTSTSFGELPGLVSGLRSLGNQTPILNSWAGDGTYWATKSPMVTNYYAVTFASIAGDDPNPAVNALAKQVKAGTGGFVTGAAAIDGIVTAIRRAGGSTSGVALAAQMVKFTRVPTISGLVSFSKQYHSVFGRQYRVIEIQDNVAKVVGKVTASSPAKI